MAQKTKVTTPEFRVSFPHLFEAQKAPNGNVAKFSVVMLFDKSVDLAPLRQIANEAVVERWPDPAKRPKNLRNPFRDGDTEKPHIEGYQNVTFITASGLRKPGVVGPDVQPIMDAAQIYPGCYGRAAVVAYAYDNAGNRGVAFGLQNFQKTREGDPLGGGGRPEDDFGPVDDAESEGAKATAAKTADFFATA